MPAVTRSPLLVVALALVSTHCWSPIFADEPVSSNELVFENRVRAILKTHCWHCHGEEEEVSGNLDLRLVRLMLSGGDSGPAIVPSDASSSLLVTKIEDGEMPPGDKKIADDELAILRQWIEAGAATARPEPDTINHDSPWTPEEKAHWAFQPIVQPPVPNVANPDQVANPVDAFVLEKLEERGLSLSPPAEKVVFIRRLSFDLLGLPPTPELVESYLNDSSPNADEKLVERFLAMPAYAERWARHWLDTAGYADSDGYTQEDRKRPWIYRYRDYVIESMLEDKPFNEFIVEQLAGDELITSPMENLSEDDARKLIATGFLCTAPDGTGQGEADPMLTRNEYVAEMLKITSSTLLGLTVGCAQCHDHRYDPISQKDYYRFRAIFEPAFSPSQWRPRPARLINNWSAEERELASQVDSKLAAIEKERLAELDALVAEVFEKELAKLPADMIPIAREARDTPADKRTDQHKSILKDFPSLNVDRGSVYLYEGAKTNELKKKFEDLAAAARSERPAERLINAATEIAGQIPTTHLLYRGDHKQPREAIRPAELSVLENPPEFPENAPELPTTGRRLAYARHLTSGEHPLLGRALVNRIWMHHFGRGLSETVSDFGALGQPPTHPELLDYIASRWAENQWSLKWLHRLICCSNTYRQSSQRSAELESIDPENRLLGRMPLRRLEAEAIRDSMIAIAGISETSMFGPPEEVNPDDVGQVIVGKATRDGNGILVAKFEEGPAQYRRSIYIEVRRSQPLGTLEPFDLPSTAPNCDRRTVSTVAPQALLLMNNRQTVMLSEKLAARLVKNFPGDSTAQVQRGWQLAFGQLPDESTLQSAIALISAQREAIETLQQQIEAGTAPKESLKTELQPEVAALALFCQAIFSSNRFLYID